MPVLKGKRRGNEAEAAMRVNIRHLQAVTNRLLDHLAAQGYLSIEIPDDYYWSIPAEQRYDALRDPDPSQFGLGQLTDDWKWLQALRRPNRDPVVQQFWFAASLFQWIGDHASTLASPPRGKPKARKRKAAKKR